MAKLMTVLVAAMTLIGCNVEVSSDAPATTSTAVSAKMFNAIQVFVLDAALEPAMGNAEVFWSEAAGSEFEKVGFVSDADCQDGKDQQIFRAYFGNSNDSAIVRTLGRCRDIVVNREWFDGSVHHSLILAHEFGHAITGGIDSHPCSDMGTNCKAVMNHFIQASTHCITETDSNWFQSIMGYPLAPACVFED